MMFYESSTRTRLGFESAVLRMEGSVIGTENAALFSSSYKGETLEDTIKVLNGYADAIVLRHPENNSSDMASDASNVPIINAGSGTSQHPTQTLLEVYTIYEKFKRFDNLSITIVGDLLRSRTANSLLYLMSKYNNNFNLVSNDITKISKDMKAHLDEKNTNYIETDQMEDVLKTSDIVYMTRIQKERINNEEEYNEIKGQFVLSNTLANTMKDDAIIMHPLPRMEEIPKDVDANKRAWYFKQAENGLYVRMALLSLLKL